VFLIKLCVRRRAKRRIRRIRRAYIVRLSLLTYKEWRTRPWMKLLVVRVIFVINYLLKIKVHPCATSLMFNLPGRIPVQGRKLTRFLAEIMEEPSHENAHGLAFRQFLISQHQEAGHSHSCGWFLIPKFGSVRNGRQWLNRKVASLYIPDAQLSRPSYQLMAIRTDSSTEYMIIPDTVSQPGANRCATI
jgi:hypothetical protein